MELIPLMKVFMPESVREPVIQTLFSGVVTQGPKAQLFEENFQKWIGNPNIALLKSGTSALALAVRLSNAGFGDEVISTPMTCLATNDVILTAGAKVKWADIDPETGNISADSIEEQITDKTKAIMVVHWSGIPVDLNKINKIAKTHGIKVIEDAAHALGATYDSKKIGLHSDYVCYSFQAVKHITSVDGGALACKTKEDYERAKLLRWFGLSRVDPSRTPVYWPEDVAEPGYKMHMNDLNATIGLEQLKYADEIVNAYKKNAKFLRAELAGLNNVQLLKIDPISDPSYWIFTIKLPNSDYRKRFSEFLFQNQIANNIVHTRNDVYSMFKESKRNDLVGVDDFCSRMLCIPCGWWLTQENLDHIVATIRKADKTL